MSVKFKCYIAKVADDVLESIASPLNYKHRGED